MGNKGEATRQSIRAAAFALFARHGYSRVTMQGICTECGLSKGGLYRHYEDKRELFTDMLRAFQQEEECCELAGIGQKLPAADIFNGYLNRIRQDLRRDVPNINIALYEFCAENRDGIGAELLSGQYRRGEEMLRSLLEYGISRGEFHAADPKGAASAILFLVEGMRMTNEVMELTEQMVTDIFNQIKEMVGMKHEI